MTAATWHAPLPDDRFNVGPQLRGRFTGSNQTVSIESDFPAALVKYQASSMAASRAMLSGEILRLLEESPTDFRRSATLAAELGVSEAEVSIALAELGDKVRKPFTSDARYQDWYRAASRGTTSREKWRRFRASAGKTAVR